MENDYGHNLEGNRLAMSLTSCAMVQYYLPEYTLEEYNESRKKLGMVPVTSIHEKNGDLIEWYENKTLDNQEDTKKLKKG